LTGIRTIAVALGFGQNQGNSEQDLLLVLIQQLNKQQILGMRSLSALLPESALGLWLAVL